MKNLENRAAETLQKSENEQSGKALRENGKKSRGNRVKGFMGGRERKHV